MLNEKYLEILIIKKVAISINKHFNKINKKILKNILLIRAALL